MRYRVIQILTMFSVFSVICFCTQKFWSSRTNLDVSTEVWIHEYLRGDPNVSLNYRQNELLPYQAKISGESRLLPMVSQLESIEGLIVCYTKLNMRDFKWLGRMKNLKHLLIYGNYESPNPGHYDELLEIICQLESLESLQLGGASFLFTKEKIVSSINSSNVKRFCLYHTSGDYIEFVKAGIDEKYDETLDPSVAFFVLNAGGPASQSTGNSERRSSLSTSHGTSYGN